MRTELARPARQRSGRSRASIKLLRSLCNRLEGLRASSTGKRRSFVRSWSRMTSILWLVATWAETTKLGTRQLAVPSYSTSSQLVRPWHPVEPARTTIRSYRRTTSVADPKSAPSSKWCRGLPVAALLLVLSPRAPLPPPSRRHSLVGLGPLTRRGQRALYPPGPLAPQTLKELMMHTFRHSIAFVSRVHRWPSSRHSRPRCDNRAPAESSSMLSPQPGWRSRPLFIKNR